MFHGRKKPYTTIGIRRVPCARCGKPSRFQWQACSNDRRFLGFCEECDVMLNTFLLAFCGILNADTLLERYCKDIEYEGAIPGIDSGGHPHVAGCRIRYFEIPKPPAGRPRPHHQRTG